MTERALRWGGGGNGELGVAGANHTDAEPDEVGGSGVFDGVEGDRGSGEDRRNAQGRGENVEQPADESAERGLDSFTAAAGQAPSQNIENAGARRDGQHQRGRKEKQEAVSVKHEGIVKILPGVRKKQRRRLDRIDERAVFGLA